MLTRRTALSGLAAIASASFLQTSGAQAAEEAHREFDVIPGATVPRVPLLTTY